MQPTLPAPICHCIAGEDLTERLMAALLSLKSQNDPASFLAAARTLVTFISNVAAHPDEPKYRRVKGGNQRYRTQLGAKPGGAECMRALGFNPIMEAGQEVPSAFVHCPCKLPFLQCVGNR